MNAQETAEAIERGIFLLPALADKLVPLSIAGVQGRISTVSNRLANVIGAAELNSQTADSTIHTVMSLFAQDNKVFCWRVGPISTPPDLASRLLAAGLLLRRNISGLAMDLTQPSSTIAPPKSTGRFTIRPATSQDTELLQKILEKSHNMPIEAAEIMSQAYLQQQDQARSVTNVHLVIDDVTGKPVAFGVTYLFPDERTVFMGGAGTLPEYRRQGLYTNLVSHRAVEARKRGIKTALIQAVDASAGVCRRIGFVDTCEVRTYIWHPDG